MTYFKDVAKVVRKLQDHGHEAVLAGGCVRDMLLKRTPNDYDIATSAKPSEVENLFEKTIPVGKSFGVIIVVEDGVEYEIATFRLDIGGKDGRHPERVEFCSMREDSLRRDFTINGLFYDPIKDKLYDFVGGQEDLKKRVLRFIGQPHKRIHEDRLRMLRFIRFLAKLDFKFDKESISSIKRNSYKILDVSPERIIEEFYKLLLSCTIDNVVMIMNYMRDTYLLSYIFPELNNTFGVEQSEEWHPEGDVSVHSILTLSSLIKEGVRDADLLFAGLIHDIGKPHTFAISEKHGRIINYGHDNVGVSMARRLCDRYKFSNKSKDKILYLIKNHMRMHQARKMKKIKLKELIYHKYFNDLLLLHKADILGSNGDLDSYYFLIDKEIQFNKDREFDHINLLSGNDLIELGFTKGPLFSDILRSVKKEQLVGKIRTKEDAIYYVNKHFQKRGDKLCY
jgi:poly(A) polymerase